MHVRVTPVSRCRADDIRIDRTMVWELPRLGQTDHVEQVCKGYFLTTVGLRANNDEAVRNSVCTQNRIVPAPPDGIGRQAASGGVQRTKIREYINSFHPAALHYRYAH